MHKRPALPNGINCPKLESFVLQCAQDAAVALEAWAAVARSQREARVVSMKSKPNKPVPRRDREGDWRGSGPIRWHRFRAATMVR